jgi:hypothetical protein
VVVRTERDSEVSDSDSLRIGTLAYRPFLFANCAWGTLGRLKLQVNNLEKKGRGKLPYDDGAAALASRAPWRRSGG